MFVLVLLTFMDLFVTVFNVLRIVRVVSIYFVSPGNRFYEGVINITEPVLGPVRRWLPHTPGLDLAPLVTFFLLQGLQYLVHRLVGA